MRIKLTDSCLNCRAGQRLALGIFQGSNGQSNTPEVIETVIRHWINNSGRIGFVLVIPNEPGVMFVGTANQGTRQGEAEKISGITSVQHDQTSLRMTGVQGTELAKIEL